MENKTLLSKNIKAQADFLSLNLRAIQIELQSIINTKLPISLKIERKTNCREEWWELNLNHNWKENCGVMSVCFKNVVLKTWDIWWDDTNESCVLQFNFNYEEKIHGSNSLEICRLRVYRNGYIERIS